MKFAYRVRYCQAKRDVVEAATLGRRRDHIRRGGLFIAEIAA